MAKQVPLTPSEMQLPPTPDAGDSDALPIDPASMQPASRPNAAGGPDFVWAKTPDGKKVVRIPRALQQEALSQQYTDPTDAEIHERQLEDEHGKGLGNEIISGLEAGARTLTFGASDELEKQLGVDPEAIRARSDYNTAGPLIGTAAALLVPGAAEKGLFGKALEGIGKFTAPGLVEKAGSAVEGAVGDALSGSRFAGRTVKGLYGPAEESPLSTIIAKGIPKTAGSAVQGSLWALQNVVTEASLGDPNLNAESIASELMVNGALGAGLGAIEGFGQAMLPAALRKARDAAGFIDTGVRQRWPHVAEILSQGKTKAGDAAYALEHSSETLDLAEAQKKAAPTDKEIDSFTKDENDLKKANQGLLNHFYSQARPSELELAEHADPEAAQQSWQDLNSKAHEALETMKAEPSLYPQRDVRLLEQAVEAHEEGLDPSLPMRALPPSKGQLTPIELSQKLDKEGGFTYQPVLGETPRSGYAVSPYKERELVLDRAGPAEIDAYAKKNADLLKEGDHFLGGWKDPESGKTYLDISVMRKTPEEANKLAAENGQKAYFNHATKESVPTKDFPAWETNVSEHDKAPGLTFSGYDKGMQGFTLGPDEGNSPFILSRDGKGYVHGGTGKFYTPEEAEDYMGHAPKMAPPGTPNVFTPEPPGPKDLYARNIRFQKAMQKATIKNKLFDPIYNDSQATIRTLGEIAKSNVEDTNRWGPAAGATAGLNNTYHDFKFAESQFKKLFGRTVDRKSGVGKDWVVDPGKVRTLLSSPDGIRRANAKEIFAEYHRGVEKLHDELEAHYKALGSAVPETDAKALMSSSEKTQEGIRQRRSMSEMLEDIEKAAKKEHTDFSFAAAGFMAHALGIGLPEAGAVAGAVKGVKALYHFANNPLEAAQFLEKIERKSNEVYQKVAKAITRLVVGDEGRLGAIAVGTKTADAVSTVGQESDENDLGRARRAAVIGFGHYFLTKRDDTRKDYDHAVKQIQTLANDPDKTTEHVSQKIAPFMAHAPATGSSLAQVQGRALSFLNSKIPNHPKLNPLDPPWRPSSEEIAKFNRYRQAVDNPLSILQQARAGTVTPEAIEAVSQVYPALYQKILSTLNETMAEHVGVKGKQIPYRSKLAISALLGKPVDASMTPQAVQQNAAVWSRVAGNAPPADAKGSPTRNQPRKTSATGASHLDISARSAPNPNTPDEKG